MKAIALFPRAAVLAALGVAGVASCSGKKLPPPGELMVAVTTDMSLPKDFDTLHVEVLVNGQTQFANDYAVGPSGLKIPATIGLVAGKDSSIPAHVRIIARKGGDTGSALLLREAVVTVPTDRLALLTLPVGWLCTGSASEPTPGDVTNATCPDGQTCAAGTCETTAIVAKTLPDYTPPAVFGGATGPSGAGGACFDTLGCFASPTLAIVDRTACTISRPGGTVNVALVVGPSGDGICSGTTCLIPLDGQSADRVLFHAVDDDDSHASATQSRSSLRTTARSRSIATGRGSLPVCVSCLVRRACSRPRRQGAFDRRGQRHPARGHRRSRRDHRRSHGDQGRYHTGSSIGAAARGPVLPESATTSSG